MSEQPMIHDTGQAPAPLLVSHQRMADQLGIGTTTLDGLVAQGCPRIRLADRTVRYYPPDVLAWLRVGFARPARLAVLSGEAGDLCGGDEGAALNRPSRPKKSRNPRPDPLTASMTMV